MCIRIWQTGFLVDIKHIKIRNESVLFSQPTPVFLPLGEAFSSQRIFNKYKILQHILIKLGCELLAPFWIRFQNMDTNPGSVADP
jgi:hypothetical protein